MLAYSYAEIQNYIRQDANTFLVTTVILNTVTVFFKTLELHNQSFLMKVQQQSAKEEKRKGENDRQKETKDKKSPNFSP